MGRLRTQVCEGPNRSRASSQNHVSCLFLALWGLPVCVKNCATLCCASGGCRTNSAPPDVPCCSTLSTDRPPKGTAGPIAVASWRHPGNNTPTPPRSASPSDRPSPRPTKTLASGNLKTHRRWSRTQTEGIRNYRSVAILSGLAEFESFAPETLIMSPHKRACLVRKAMRAPGGRQST